MTGMNEFGLNRIKRPRSFRKQSCQPIT